MVLSFFDIDIIWDITILADGEEGKNTVQPLENLLYVFDMITGCICSSSLPPQVSSGTALVGFALRISKATYEESRCKISVLAFVTRD